MKYDIKEKIIISEHEKIKEQDKIFNQNFEKFNKKQYNSLGDEIKRIIYTPNKAVLNFNIKSVFQTFLELASKDINNNLNANDIAEGWYYMGSKKQGKQIIKVSEFIRNEIITIEWFTETHYFKREVLFYDRGETKTLIKYNDECKSMKSVFGVIDTYKKKQYQKQIKNSFKIQIIQILLKLESDTVKTEILSKKLEQASTKAKKI